MQACSTRLGTVGVISFSVQIIPFATKGLPCIGHLPQFRQLRRHVEHPDVGERQNRFALGPNICLVAREKN